MNTRRRSARLRAGWWAALAVALLAEALLYAVFLPRAHLKPAVALLASAAPVWVIAVLAFSRVRCSVRAATLVVLGVGAVFQLLAISSRPSTSDDDYRYIWDAKVQLSGIDPYRYAPTAAPLETLREPFFFGDPPCAHHLAAGGCSSINRAGAHTIYPPVAEAAFTVIRLVSFGGHSGHAGHLPYQIAAALGSLVVGWLVLRRHRDRPWLAALWTWSPVAVIEYGNNAHIDWLAVLLVALAFAARSVWLAGALVGAAVAVKLYPLLVLPSLLRRSWRVGVAAAALVVAVYVPHVIAVGTAVLGYLPGYLREEQYGSGARLLLVGTVLPHPADTIVGVLIVGATAVWALWFAAGPPQRSAVVVVGVTFLVFTPAYGWYAGLLLVLVALSGAIEWTPVVVAPAAAYLDHGQHDALYYAVAALAVAVLAIVRHGGFTRPSRSTRPGDRGSRRRPRRTTLPSA